MALANPTTPFLWGAGGAMKTPEQIAREREIAAALMQGGSDYSPVDSWVQGAARAAQAGAGALKGRWADEAEATGRGGFQSRFDSVFGGGQAAPVQTAAIDPVAEALMGAPATATDATAAIGQAAPVTSNVGGDKQAFIDMLMPDAIEASQRTGIDPRIIIAQAAQETGWGKSAPGNNYFGIKSHGQGGGQTLNTHEYINGQRVNVADNFRAFGSPGESVAGYADFIQQNPRYKPLMQAQGLDAQLEALQASGYATDPNYSSSVGSIARGISLPGGGTMPAPMQTAQAGPQPSMEELIGLSSDPWANDSQKAIIQSLLGQQIEQQDPMYQLQMQAAQQGLTKGDLEIAQLLNPQVEAPKPIEVGGVLLDPTTYQPIFDSRQPEGSDPTSAMQNYEYLVSQGMPEADAMERAFSGGGTNVTVNNGETNDFYKKLDTDLGAQQVALIDAGQVAQGNNMRLGQLEQILSTAPQGAQGALVQFAGSIGLPVEGASDLQAAQAIINQMVPGQRPPGSGTMSDADLALFKQSLPSIINQPGGNAKIISTTKAINEYTIKQAEIARQIANRELTPAEGRAAQAAIPNPLAELAAAGAPGAAPAAPAASPPSGAMDYNAPEPPAGWGGDAGLWRFMSPEDRALW